VALLVAAGNGARLRSKVVVPRELEDPRMESHEISLSLEDGALDVVVENGARQPPNDSNAATWPQRKLSVVRSR
jgi:hypothetical protein